MKHWQVVVVGAGPVGLSLALGLARQGLEVLVLEKNAGTAEHSRAPAIWPGTQEILADLGVIDAFMEEGVILRRLELRDVDYGTNLMTLPLEELYDRTAYPHLLVLPQSRTEKLLLEALEQEATAEVRFSSEVTELIQHPEEVEVHVNGREEDSAVLAEFVVGCDGAGSTTRDAIDARLKGITYSFRAALADVQLEGKPVFHSPRLTSRPRIAIGIRMAGNLWRMILPFSGTEDRSLDRSIEDAAQSLFVKNPWQPVWQSEFRLHNRVATTFAKNRIVLAGDAAHLNSPVGGQGMNSGIQDTALLTKAMVEALDQGDNTPLLRFGVERRRKILKGVNRFTDNMTRLLLMGEGRMIRPTLGLVNTALHVPPVRRRILRRLAMLE